MEKEFIFLRIVILVILMPVRVVQAMPIADSVSEFSANQGQDNWYYGYYDGDGGFPYTNNPAGDDFELMTQFGSDNAWWVQEGQGGFWTKVGQESMFPNGTVTSYGRQPVLHWAVRRWLSEVTGPITISGRLGKFDTGYSDGITGYILLDGVVVWSYHMVQHGSVGVDYTIDVDVDRDSLVDFAISPGPNGNDWEDWATFTAVVTESTTLTVLTPNGGETLIAGTTYTINWSSTGSITDVLIEYSTDGGSTWRGVEPPNIRNNCLYEWLVPAVTSDQCLIRITDMSGPIPGVSDTSDVVFTIIPSELLLRFYLEKNGVSGFQEGQDQPVAKEDVYYENRHEPRFKTDSEGKVTIVEPKVGDLIFVRHLAYSHPAAKGERSFAGSMFDLYLDTDSVSGTGDLIPFQITGNHMESISRGQVVDICLSHPVFSWNLVVVLDWLADSAYLYELQEGLRESSKYFFDVTDGHMKLGRLDIRDNIPRVLPMWWLDADVKISSSYSKAETEGPFPGQVSSPGLQIRMPRRSRPITPSFYYLFVHELGHYLLGFYDEYIDAWGNRQNWRDYRANNPNETPDQYGLMDWNLDGPEMSSGNDYLSSYGDYAFPCVYPLYCDNHRVTMHIYAYELRWGLGIHKSCWEVFFDRFDNSDGHLGKWSNYDGIRVGISMPSAGVYLGRNMDGSENRSSEDRPGPWWILSPYKDIDCQFSTWTPLQSEDNLLESVYIKLVVLGKTGMSARGAHAWIEKTGGKRIEQGRTGRDGKLVCVGAAEGDTIWASFSGQIKHAKVEAESEIVISFASKTLASASAGSEPRLVLDAGISEPNVLQIRVISNQNLPQPPAVSVRPWFGDPCAVAMYQIDPSTYEGTIDIGHAYEGSVDVCAVGSGGQTDTSTVFRIQQLLANESVTIYSPEGWLDAHLPHNMLDANTLAVTIGSGDTPIAPSDPCLTFIAEPVSFRLEDGLSVGPVYTLNWHINTGNLAGCDANTLTLQRFNKATGQWRQVAASFTAGFPVISASDVNEGIYALFARESNDVTPPGTIANLSAATGEGGWSVVLNWTAPGDDANTGQAVRYHVLFSTETIIDPNCAECLELPMRGKPKPAGQAEHHALEMPDPDTHYYFAVRAADEAGNVGAISNIAHVTSYVRDTDADGLSDQWEQAYGFDPNTPGDETFDTDGDGLSNLQEYRFRTLPNVWDTDGDGITDGIELVDFDFDGNVNFADFCTFAIHWLDKACLPPDRCAGTDLDWSGLVTTADLGTFADHWLQNVETPPALPGQASNPDPVDGATGVSTTADLSWTAGSYTASHDVYFGTSNPPPFVCNQTSATYEPGLMNYSSTYYWRIDEVNWSGKNTGNVWRFTTMMSPPTPP